MSRSWTVPGRAWHPYRAVAAPTARRRAAPPLPTRLGFPAAKLSAMATAAPWVFVVISFINGALLLLTLGIGLTAFVHCLLQRADAFPAIGTLSKPIWLALIGVTFLLSWLLAAGGVSLFSLIAAGVSLVYLLDVRPALRDVTDGRGPW